MATQNFKIRAALSSDIAPIGEIVALSWQHTFRGLVSPEFLAPLSAEQQERHHRNETIRDVYSDGFAFAAAIRGADGSVVAAVSLAGTLDQLTPENRPVFRAAVFSHIALSSIQ